VLENEKQSSTDSLGHFTIDILQPGTYTFLILKKGYEEQIINDIYVAGKGIKRLHIDLVPQISSLQRIEVRASSFRRSPDMSSSTKIISADELLRAPGALSDVQRVVQNLPSVSSAGDNINEVVVRGGMPGENLLIMDNIEIPNANHFADQHSGGGVISLINPLLVKGLTFSAGAPPSQYGGKASSVLDVTLRNGNDEIVLGGIDIGMAGAGGHIEGPLWKNSNFMVSGHISFLDFYARIEPTAAIPQFKGLQLKISQKFLSNSLKINGIYGNNYIKIQDLKKEGAEYNIIESGGIVYAGGMSWKTQWTDRLQSTIVFTGTGNTFDRFTYNPAYDTIIDNNNQSIGVDTFYFSDSWEDIQTLKAECAFKLAQKNKMLTGTYVKRYEFSINQISKYDTLKNYVADTVKGVPVVDTSGKLTIFSENTQLHDTTFKYGVYISFILHAFDRFRLVPGFRVDKFAYNNFLSISPRFNSIFSINDNLDFTAAFGLQYQDPELVDFSLDIRNKKLKSKQALTGIVGIEYYANQWDIKLIFEGFYKNYKNLLFDADLITKDSLDQSSHLIDEGKGHSFGIELFAQKKLQKSFFGTVAFSLSKSLYKDLRPGHEGEWYDGDYDFRHSLTFTGGWKKELMKSKWYKNKFHSKLWFKILSPIMPIADRMEFSMKWRFLGSRPYTKKKFSYSNKCWYIDTREPLNNKRLNPYHRLDLRFERRYGFGLLQLIYYIDIQNIYSKKNIWTYIYQKNEEKIISIPQLPFIPAGGIIIGF
jgi:hypothetical protein